MAKKKPEQTPDDQNKLVQEALSELRKKIPGVVIGLGSDSWIKERIEYKKIPFTIDALNVILDGGIPEGKVTVLSGAKSSGKSTASYGVIANFQAAHPDKYVVIHDTESALDQRWLEKHGVDLSRVIVIPACADLEASADAAIDIMSRLKDMIGLYLLDSVGAMVPRSEITGKKTKKKDDDGGQSTMDNDGMAVVAKKMGQFLRKTIGLFSTHRIAAIFIAHVYADLSPTGGGRLLTKGGNALHHFAHVMLRFSRKNDEIFYEDLLGVDGQVHKIRAGYMTEILVEKTKQSSGDGKVISIPFRVGLGFDTAMATFHGAVGYGVIERSGSFYLFKGERIANGAAKALVTLRENDVLFEQVRKELLEAISQRTESPVELGDDAVFEIEAPEQELV